MRRAGLSVDVDSVASHLAGYGMAGYGIEAEEEGAPAAYELAIPRALEAFASEGARATFFLIADEAKQHPDVVRAIVEQGHEVASHSLTHALPFPAVDGPALRQEVDESKRVLEALTGAPVVGFRAPSWEYSTHLVDALGRAGYRYDASTYPSPLLVALRRSVAKRSVSGRARARPSPWLEWLRRPGVHTVDSAHGPIVEVPVCTTPVLRLPYYHTLSFMLPAWAQRGIGALARRRRSGVSYCFHAVDFLGLNEDRLDARLAVHPGMRLPRARKLAGAVDAVRALGRRHDVVPLAELAQTEWANASYRVSISTPLIPISASTNSGSGNGCQS